MCFRFVQYANHFLSFLQFEARFYALVARVHVLRRRRDASSHITSGFMDAADDLAN